MISAAPTRHEQQHGYGNPVDLESDNLLESALPLTGLRRPISVDIGSEQGEAQFSLNLGRKTGAPPCQS